MQSLLEMQFDLNQKFKNTINNIKDAKELRAQPIGKDKFGNDYWCTIDEKCNIRVFQENVDDETWKIVAGYGSFSQNPSNFYPKPLYLVETAKNL